MTNLSSLVDVDDVRDMDRDDDRDADGAGVGEREESELLDDERVRDD